MKNILLIRIALWALVGVILITGMVYLWVGGQSISRALNGLARGSGSLEILADFTVEMDGIDEVNLDFSSDKVDIYLTDDKTARVIHRAWGMDASERATFHISGRILRITRPSAFRIGFVINRNSQVEIYLPRSFDKSLYADLSSGSITVHDELNVSDLTLKASSGAISTLSPVRADKVTMKLSSGNLNLQQVVSDTFDMEITSGRIRAENLSGSGNIRMSSGSVDVNSLTITGDVAVRITSGRCNIGMEGNPSLDYTGRVTSGRLKTYFPTSTGGNSHPGGGDYFAQVGDGPYHKLSVDISSGSMDITQV